MSRSLAILVPGLLSGFAGSAASKGKGPGRGGGKKKPKPPKRPKPKPPKRPRPPRPPAPPPPSEPDICDTTWPDEKNRNHCKAIRAQCPPGGSREFCIIEGNPFDPAKVAICCAEGGTCCGDVCCGGGASPYMKCCNGTCVNTNIDGDNCRTCGKQCRRSSWLGHEICRDGDCVCAEEGAVWDDVCQACISADSNYYCCSAFGHMCPKTHDCIVMGVNPDGTPRYGCNAKTTAA